MLHYFFLPVLQEIKIDVVGFDIFKCQFLKSVVFSQMLAGLSDEQDRGARAAVSDMDWLDNLSESGSSNLSKIDWAAIERMVAAGEA